MLKQEAAPDRDLPSLSEKRRNGGETSKPSLQEPDRIRLSVVTDTPRRWPPVLLGALRHQGGAARPPVQLPRALLQENMAMERGQLAAEIFYPVSFNSCLGLTFSSTRELRF